MIIIATKIAVYQRQNIAAAQSNMIRRGAECETVYIYLFQPEVATAT